MILPSTVTNKLNSAIKKCFKSSVGFQSSLPDSILHSHWGYRIFNIEDRQLQLHATELMNRLNMDNECGVTTRIRLQYLQNRIWSDEPIWQLSAESWHKFTHLGLNGQILALLAENDINFNVTTQNQFPICPIGGNISISKFMNSVTWYNINREACRKHKVLFIEQLINADMTKTLKWLNIDQVKPTSIIPYWFNEVCAEINTRWEEITQSADVNPFNRTQPIAPEIIKKQLMVATSSKNQVLIGRVYKNPRKLDTTIPIRHYVTDVMDDIRGSPIAPCDGCEFNEVRTKGLITQDKGEKLKGCIFDVNMDDIYTLPCRKSVVSLSNKNDRRQRNRLLLSPFSMNTFIKQSKSLEQENTIQDITPNNSYWNGILTFPIDIQKKIDDIQILLVNQKNISVYTDGSLSSKDQLKTKYTLQTDKSKVMSFGITFDISEIDTPIDICGRIEEICSINEQQLRDRKALFKWNNKNIDTSIKEFIKKKSEIKWLVKWRTQYRTNKWANQYIVNSTDWISTWEFIHDTKIVSNYTSTEDQKYRSFNIKILNDELPVMNNLNQRKPTVYTTNKCSFCKTRIEDSIHPFLCGEQAEKTKSKFESSLLDTILDHKGREMADKVKHDLNNFTNFKLDIPQQINGTSPTDTFGLIDYI
ncbi:988_t:CDS:2 [Dentiscutata erythropus]|uniref:988_t:CDS:1 n=1 Tax=Dentiscutata erythropus TaxID=1348616 RepID=A0A9N9N283_9GLOM|nr:988_t:CDS:2 [Dentiscutata erythropus]